MRLAVRGLETEEGFFTILVENICSIECNDTSVMANTNTSSVNKVIHSKIWGEGN